MQSTKEVEIAKSIGEPVTSRSIVGRKDFTDYDMLDAMIASALKKLITNMHFLGRMSTEELELITRHDFYEGGKLLF